MPSDCDDEGRLQLESAAQVHALRRKLHTREHEVVALQDQVVALTTQLRETSDELECRMNFVADAMTQIESFELQVAEAKRSLLTREMQLHEGRQREKALELALQGKEKQSEHWENEFHRVGRELLAQTTAERDLSRELEANVEDARAWKAKLQAVMTSVDELKLQNSNLRKKEREIVATLREQVQVAETSQRSWKNRLAKRQVKIETLQRQCQDREEELEHVKLTQLQTIEERERDRIDISEQQLEKQQQLIVLREEIEKLSANVEKMQAKEQIFKQEIFRLRQEILLSESQRETEHRRYEQLIEGKEKEVAFIWHKYVEIVPLVEGR